MAANFRRIARVAKARGTKGEVVAVPVDGLPPLLSEGLEVAIVPPELRTNRWHVVREVQTQPSGQLVSLSGLDSLGEAKGVAGKWVVAREADLPADLLAHDPVRLVGRSVVDERLGELGHIEDVMMGPAHDVWQVLGERGETLIPVVDAIVLDVPAQGDILVSCPVGLAPGDEPVRGEEGGKACS